MRSRSIQFPAPKRVFGLVLLLFVWGSNADVVVPVSRDLIACIAFTSDQTDETTLQSKDAIAILMTAPLASELRESVRVSVRNEAEEFFERDWKRLEAIASIARQFKPEVWVSIDLTRYEEGVPQSRRRRDQCLGHQVLLSVTRTGLVENIWASNICKPGTLALCSLFCTAQQCAFQPDASPRAAP